MIRLVVVLAALFSAGASAQPLQVRSPDGRNVATVALDGQGRPTYAVSRGGEALIAPSPVGLELTSDKIGYGMTIEGSETGAGDTRYPIVVGTASEGRDHHNQLTVRFVEQGGKRRRMDLVVRAYDDGVAFRTVLPTQESTAGTLVRAEETEFRFAAAPRCRGFNVGRFGSSHEGEFDPVELARVREHNLFDVPFLCETEGAAFVLAEADLHDFAGMMLGGRGDGGPGLRVRLSPSLEDPRIAVRTRTGGPVETPWRVVMLADRAGELIESTLLTDLARPSRIADTSWIRPGRGSWDWWNGNIVASVPGNGNSTERSKAFIDFAAENGLEYSLIDDGWYAGAGGGGLTNPAADLTRWAPGFDLEAVLAHARTRNVGVWLWVNWRALDAQMEEAMALYARLGVVGIKVDFMDRDDQWMVDWYDRLMEAAARNRLMVNLHGAYAPRGLTRTWPNYVTQEGVLGAEYNKWSRRITAEHNVMLAYTRAMIGPADYTPGGFRNVAPAEFAPRNDLPFVQTTRAHGLAMYVVYSSPVAMVSDSPDTYGASPAGLEFIRGVPTSWDETRFLGGEVGAWVAVARRKGERWYVGVMNGAERRRVRVPLDFLEGSAHAEIWADGGAPTDVITSTRTVSRTLNLDLAATGGAVAVLELAR